MREKKPVSRRKLLTAGAAGAICAVAGCSGDSEGNGGLTQTGIETVVVENELLAGQGMRIVAGVEDPANDDHAPAEDDEININKFDIDIAWDTGSNSATLSSETGPDA